MDGERTSHPGAHLKTEAWYVLQHDPGSKIYKGLCEGMTRESFEQAVKDGTIEQCIQTVEIKPGDCHFMPSGTVHALGAGILAWEVQTPSDTTYRVFDFNRIDASNLCQECGGRVLATDPVAVGDHKLKPLFVVDDVPS